MGINRVLLSGNLTRDPELRSTRGGTRVLSFSLAVNGRYRDQQTGEWADRPDYVDCTLFGGRADGLARCLSKGSKIAVEGRLRYSTWMRDDERRSKLEVVVDEVELMGGGRQAAQRCQEPPYWDGDGADA